LNSYKISVKEWAAKTKAIGLRATAGRYGGTYALHVYGDKLVLTYNCNAGTKTITLADVDVSDLTKCAPPSET
jgi:hypothetical protein